MTEAKTPASAGMEWISNLLGSTDKNLDQVKKSVQTDLDKLKKGTDVAANLYVSAENGFKMDLDEIGIHGDAQKTYLAAFSDEWKKNCDRGRRRERRNNRTIRTKNRPSSAHHDI